MCCSSLHARGSFITPCISSGHIERIGTGPKVEMLDAQHLCSPFQVVWRNPRSIEQRSKLPLADWGGDFCFSMLPMFQQHYDTKPCVTDKSPNTTCTDYIGYRGGTMKVIMAHTEHSSYA